MEMSKAYVGGTLANLGEDITASGWFLGELRRDVLPTRVGDLRTR